MITGINSLVMKKDSAENLPGPTHFLKKMDHFWLMFENNNSVNISVCYLYTLINLDESHISKCF